MSAARALAVERTLSTELLPIAENDIAEVAGFIAVQSGRASETVDAHLRWFLLQNPERDSTQPLGYGLYVSAQLVGCILCSPQLFRYRNETILMMGSSSFYVEERHRGKGGRLFLQYSRLGNRWPLFGTSANPSAAELWKSAGANPILSSEGEIFGILNWPPIAEEFAQRRTSNGLLSRLAGSSMSQAISMFRPLKVGPVDSDALHPLSSAEQVKDLMIPETSEKLTAMRDPAYLHWRYFSGRDTSAAVFAFRSPQHDREILVTVNQRSRGYRGQIKTLNVLDVYPEVSSSEWLRIATALMGRYAKQVDALVLRNQNREQRTIFCEAGFQWRSFDAPNGWLLDKAKPLPTRNWYMTPADGDCLI